MKVDPMKPTNAPGSKRLKLRYDELLSSFAFNFNLRRYTEAKTEVAEARAALAEKQLAAHVAEQEAAEAERTAVLAA